MFRDEPSKVLLLGAGFGTQNMGVGALASGALRCLRAGGRKPEVALLDYGTEDMVRTTDPDGRELVLPIVAMRFSKKFYLSNNIVVLLSLAALLRIFPWQSLRTFILNRNACLRQITQVDTAVALSGGDSFSDIYGLGRFFYVCLPQLLILLLQKNLVLLPQTLGPFAKPFPRYIARMILAGAERVYSRDRAGIEQLKLLLGKRFDGSKHRFRYDLGFVVDPRRAERISFAGFDGDARDGNVVVGLNVSGLLWVSQRNKFGFRSDYRETVRAVIRRMLSIDNVKLLLVPHVFGDLPGSESDLVTCAEVFREMAPQYPGRIGMLESILDQSEVKAVIGGCDFFIGSRMHACIAALSQHVPAVAIAYSSKFIGVLDTIGVPSLVADARKQDTDEILRVISDSFGSRDMLHEHLARRIPAIRTAILEICDEIPAFQVHRGSTPEPVLSAH
jgi:polysaccharide pyruvyl transferase WcaK-like protein